jgi:hypothetical protein
MIDTALRSEPLVAIMSKRIFHALMLILSLYCATYVYLSIGDPGLPLYQSVDAMRASTRSATADGGPGPAVASFVPIFGPGGCKLNRSLWTPGPIGARGTSNFSLSAPVQAVGYRLDTVCEVAGSGRKWEDESFVAVVEGRDSVSGSWNLLPNFDDTRCQQKLIPLRVNGTVCWRTVLSIEKDWAWYIRFLGSSFAGALGFAVTLALALSGHQRPARWAVLATFWLYAGCITLAVTGEMANGARVWASGSPVTCYARCIVDITYAVPFTLLAMGMTMAQTSPVVVLLTFSIVHIAFSAFRTSALPKLFNQREQDSMSLIMSDLVGPQLLALGLAMSLVFFRQKALWEARRLVRNDAALYNAAWEELVSHPGLGSLLDELSSLLVAYGPAKERAVRQLYRHKGVGSASSAACPPLPRILRSDPEVGFTCLPSFLAESQVFSWHHPVVACGSVRRLPPRVC